MLCAGVRREIKWMFNYSNPEFGLHGVCTMCVVDQYSYKRVEVLGKKVLHGWVYGYEISHSSAYIDGHGICIFFGSIGEPLSHTL